MTAASTCSISYGWWRSKRRPNGPRMPWRRTRRSSGHEPPGRPKAHGPAARSAEGGPVSLLSMRDVQFAFPGWPPTVAGVDLDVEEGAFHCLVGRSGCGKTTLLKLAAGLLAPDRGSVVFKGGARDI